MNNLWVENSNSELLYVRLSLPTKLGGSRATGWETQSSTKPNNTKSVVRRRGGLLVYLMRENEAIFCWAYVNSFDGAAEEACPFSQPCVGWFIFGICRQLRSTYL